VSRSTASSVPSLWKPTMQPGTDRNASKSYLTWSGQQDQNLPASWKTGAALWNLRVVHLGQSASQPASQPASRSLVEARLGKVGRQWLTGRPSHGSGRS
jgi:hypothetical protein